MRFFCALLLALTSVPAVALVDCACEVTALSPMRASQSVLPRQVGRFLGREFGEREVGAADVCLRECRRDALGKYPRALLEAELVPWAEELASEGAHGRICSGPTTFKIPVHVKAQLGDRPLGIAHRTVVFLHREQNCP